MHKGELAGRVEALRRDLENLIVDLDAHARGSAVPERERLQWMLGNLTGVHASLARFPELEEPRPALKLVK